MDDYTIFFESLGTVKKSKGFRIQYFVHVDKLMMTDKKLKEFLRSFKFVKI